jgi:hypothetical protein
MPERFPTSKPEVICGTNLFSGTPNTGQQPTTYGGSNNFQKFSGTVGPDLSIWVGAGRLDNFASLGTIGTTDIKQASGQPIIFYDSAIAASGGPIAASGHKIIAILDTRGFPLPGGNPNIFNSGALSYGYPPTPVGAVFTSGLCVSMTSGQVGFNVSFTPVVSG